MANTIKRDDELDVYRDFFNHCGVGLAISTADRFVRVNDTLARMHGYERDELEGKPIAMIKADPTGLPKVIEHVEETGRRVWHDIARRRDGSTFPVLLVAQVVKNNDGSVKYRIVTIQDISAQQTEQQLHQLELAEQQRLSSLGTLAGGIAHDFNNLLAAVVGNAELALGTSDSSELASYLHKIQLAARQGSKLTEQLLAYAGKGAFTIEPVDIGNLARETAELLEVTLRRKAVLAYQLEPNLPLVDADPTQLRQVIMNLVTNAADAIETPGGRISVRAFFQQAAALVGDTTVIRGTLPEGAAACIEVADNGVGMTPDTVSQMFHPFFSSKGRGRGLGLSAVLGIVTAHGGAILIDTAEHHGTRINVVLPPSKAEGLEASTANGPLAPGDSSKGVVLLVDDDANVRGVTAALLEKLGFDVLPTGDGAEAMAIFEAYRETLSLVLLDMTMPHMDGPSVLEELRKLECSVPVVFMSGFSDQDPGSTRGAAGFIAKPFTSSSLRAKLQEVMKRSSKPA